MIRFPGGAEMQQPRSKTRNGPGTTNTGPTGTTNEKPKIGLVKSEPGVSPPNASPSKANLPLADSGYQSYGSLFYFNPTRLKKGQLMAQNRVVDESDLTIRVFLLE